jgi:hypothetical protein
MKINDRFILRLSYFYLGFPFLVFLFGWLQWFLAWPLAAIFCWAMYSSQKTYLADNQIVNRISKNPKVFFWVLLTLIIYVFFSGIGSYSYQNEDHHYRNAIFQDLINKPWPVIYQIEGFKADNPLEGQQTLLVYYLGYWLPSALIGHIFGLKVGSFALYLWTLLGLNLVFYYFCKYFKTYSIKMLWLFLGWGSLYIIGTLYSFQLKEVLKGNVYLWAGNMLYADGNTGLIYWTFNQTIAPWLIILLIMNQLKASNLFFLSSLMFFFGPFAFIGFVPFVLYFIYKIDFSKLPLKADFGQLIFKYFTFENIAGSLSVLLISYLYFSSNSSGNVFNITIHDTSTYLLFVFLSIGIISIIIFNRYKINVLYYFILVILLVLPFFQLGFGLDLTARASIPAMFFLMLLAVEYLLFAEIGFRRNLVLVYMALAFLGHNLQFARSVYFTSIQALSNSSLAIDIVKSKSIIFRDLGDRLIANSGKNITIKNDLGTLSNPNNFLVRNFMGLTKGSFFYKHLAKKNGK